jgi:hypothetical protein
VSRVAVLLHERLGNWARQLRPRLVDRPIRWFETRSASDLERVLGTPGLACPIVVLDLGTRPFAGLRDLDRVCGLASDALVLVLDPGVTPGLRPVAIELGASFVITGPVPPPDVARLLDRWVTLSLRRLARSGWSEIDPREAEPEPWNWLKPYLASSSPSRIPASSARTDAAEPVVVSAGGATSARNGVGQGCASANRHEPGSIGESSGGNDREPEGPTAFGAGSPIEW